MVDYVWFTDKQWGRTREALIERIEKELGYPVIIKPANLGSSIGIGSAHDREQLIARIDDATRYSSRIIVEKMVKNLQEINCSVLGDCDEYETSVLEEPIKSGDFLDYGQKYMGGAKNERGMQASKKRIPADLPADETERIRHLAGETFRVLGCHGVSRVDVMIDADTRDIYVNEINTIPALCRSTFGKPQVCRSTNLWTASCVSLSNANVSRKPKPPASILTSSQWEAV